MTSLTLPFITVLAPSQESERSCFVCFWYRFCINTQLTRGRRGRASMVIEFITTYVISVYHHQRLEFESLPGEVYSIQHHAIKFVSELRHVGGFLPVLRFPQQIKLIATI